MTGGSRIVSLNINTED